MGGGAGTLFGTEYRFTFDAGGTSFGDGIFATVLDTRPLDSLVDPGGQTGAMCDLLLSLGVSCAPCPDGSGTYCLPMVAHGVTGSVAAVVGTDPETGQPTIGLTEVTQAQVTDWTNQGHCP